MTSQTPTVPKRDLFTLYATEAWFEFLKLLRLPVYSVSVLGFPIVFYALFGTIFGSETTQGLQVGRFMVGGYSAAGVLSAALFGFGVAVATERAQGWMRLKRVSPMPALAYFAAKLAMATIFSGLSIASLTLLSRLMGLARFGFVEWLAMFGVLLLGVLPFGALGVALGYLFGPNSAPVVINLLFTPLAFASGLWIPVQVLPKVVQDVAVYLPTYHYGQLVVWTIGAEPSGSVMTHFAVLGVTTVAFLALAVFAYFRDEGKTFG